MINLLVDELPTSVEIGGVEYAINSNFRHLILFEMLMLDDALDEQERTAKALNLFYPTMPNDITAAVDFMLWFYRCGENVADKKTGKTGQQSERIYDFDFDDKYIYAAFLDQYGIDLQDISYLHWWKFKALFYALKDDNQLSKIMGFRAFVIDGNMPQKQREFYLRMKDVYKMPLSNSEQEKTDAIAYALQNGGDLNGVL